MYVYVYIYIYTHVCIYIYICFVNIWESFCMAITSYGNARRRSLAREDDIEKKKESSRS